MISSLSTSKLLKKIKNKSTNYRLMVDIVCFYLFYNQFTKHIKMSSFPKNNPLENVIHCSSIYSFYRYELLPLILIIHFRIQMMLFNEQTYIYMIILKCIIQKLSYNHRMSNEYEILLIDRIGDTLMEIVNNNNGKCENIGELRKKIILGYVQKAGYNFLQNS